MFYLDIHFEHSCMIQDLMKYNLYIMCILVRGEGLSNKLVYNRFYKYFIKKVENHYFF